MYLLTISYNARICLLFWQAKLAWIPYF